MRLTLEYTIDASTSTAELSRIFEDHQDDDTEWFLCDEVRSLLAAS